jgi:hypothetical protein
MRGRACSPVRTGPQCLHQAIGHGGIGPATLGLLSVVKYLSWRTRTQGETPPKGPGFRRAAPRSCLHPSPVPPIRWRIDLGVLLGWVTIQDVSARPARAPDSAAWFDGEEVLGDLREAGAREGQKSP